MSGPKAQASMALPTLDSTKTRTQQVCYGGGIEGGSLKPAAQAQPHRYRPTKRQPYAILEEGLFIRSTAPVGNTLNHAALKEHHPVEKGIDMGSSNGMTSAPTREDAEHLVGLKTIMIPKEKLKQNGYVLEDLTQQELDRKKRCAGCGKSELRQVVLTEMMAC